MNSPARRCQVLLLAAVLIGHPLPLSPVHAQTGPAPASEPSPESATSAPSTALAVLPWMPFITLPATHFAVLLPIDGYYFAALIYFVRHRIATPPRHIIHDTPP